MEKFALTLRSKTVLKEHRGFARYEKELAAEIILAIEQKNTEVLNWFNGFGDSLRAILMNVHAYHKGLEFGFTEIAFGQYGWFVRPQFLDYEVIKPGNSERYGEYSEIRIGRGPNGIWSYALNYSFGCAGGGSALSVYDPHFASRDAALDHALAKLKVMFTAQIGSSDTTNYKQDIIQKTLKAIDQQMVAMIQLSLF
ncbi:hypothetical protein D0C36_16235 [Mucilaginibacter conchicola]|uniref:Uncharacterized protein n=1 Tax=Mucilaginibacter conchicola TaxID=2303333 RepID=A0A372NUM7_9SPHI|nr:hypothetical protein [Mucilaginibacter conchicola]RFZ92936.1 hypothetical protein D0C36_16235 [Mucilaginibacter conchicola]